MKKLLLIGLGLAAISSGALARDHSDRRDHIITDVYRFQCPGYHYYDISYSAPHGCRYEGVAFSVYRSQVAPGMEVLRQCYVNGYQFLSKDYYCEGHARGRVLGYLAPYADDPYHREVYRFNQWGGTDHLTTIDLNEGYAAGYHFEGSLGFAPF